MGALPFSFSMTSARRGLVFGSLAVALGALALATASRLAIAEQRAYDIELVPTAGALRLSSAGHPTLAANLHWLRAVQYMGDPRADARGWDKLFPVLDLVTDLDPRHGYAYQVGGNLLSSVGRLSESNRLLEKGIRNLPTRYILPFHRAVNAFLYAGDYVEAARWFERAAQTPGAPARLQQYVAAMYVKGNAPEAAISFLRHMYESADDEESRRALLKQIDQAVLERDAARLEAAAAAFRERLGVAPVAVAALVAEGVVDEVPADPFGGEYYLDADGRVRSSAHPHRFARPETPEERAQTLRAPRRAVQKMGTAQP